jgi:hypothetical protein
VHAGGAAHLLPPGDLGARDAQRLEVDLSFAFCRLAVEQDDRELRLCLDDEDVPADVRAFVVARDLAGLRVATSPSWTPPPSTCRCPRPTS